MKLSSKKGFTLVELIIVISIIAILASLAFMALSGETAQARDSKRVSDLKTFEDAIATANGKNKKIDYSRDNIGTTSAAAVRNAADTDPKTKDIGTSSGVVKPIRGAALLPIQAGIIDSDVLPSIAKDPKGADYLVAFLSNTAYSLFASKENPDTKQPSAIVRGTFSAGAILDVMTAPVTATGTSISVSNANRFVRGDIIKIDDEMMVVLGIDATNNLIGVTRGFVTSGGTNGILASSLSVHNGNAAIKIIYPAAGADSLVCLGTQAAAANITRSSPSDNTALSLTASSVPALPSGYSIASIPSGFTAGNACDAASSSYPIADGSTYLPYKVN